MNLLVPGLPNNLQNLQGFGHAEVEGSKTLEENFVGFVNWNSRPRVFF